MNRKSGFQEFAAKNNDGDEHYWNDNAHSEMSNKNMIVEEEEEEEQEEEENAAQDIHVETLQEEEDEQQAITNHGGDEQYEDIERKQSDAKPVFAVAQHSYTAGNEDELEFEVGDRILILQQPESGGWWQGEHDGDMGWFPANHVVVEVVSDPSFLSIVGATLSGSVMSPVPSDDGSDGVLKILFVGEKSYVDKLLEFQTTFLTPLKSVGWLNAKEKAMLCNPLDAVITSHQAFLRALAVEMTKMNDKHVDLVICNYLPQLLVANSRFYSVVGDCLNLVDGPDVKSAMKDYCEKMTMSWTPVEALEAPFNRMEQYAALEATYTTQCVTLLGSIVRTCKDVIAKQKELNIRDDDIDGLPNQLNFNDFGDLILKCDADVTVVNFRVDDAVLLLFANHLVILSPEDAFEGRMSYSCESVADLVGSKTDCVPVKRTIEIFTPSDGMNFKIKFDTNYVAELWACALCRNQEPTTKGGAPRMRPLTISKHNRDALGQQQNADNVVEAPPPVPMPYASGQKPKPNPKSMKRLFSRQPKGQSLKKAVKDGAIEITKAPFVFDATPSATATATEYSVITAYSTATLTSTA